jgi:DNA-binding MurR/RpiR family transcriptional regulator
LFRYNPYEEIRGFAKLLDQVKNKYIFIYATGFSAIAAEYMYKKFLVLGKKCIFSSGVDSIGIFENNLDDMAIFIAISKSGETKAVIDKLKTAKETLIKTVAVTGDGPNSLGKLADIHFQIQDNNKLDDRNMTANNFFPNVLLLIEVLVYEHHKILYSEKLKL